MLSRQLWPWVMMAALGAGSGGAYDLYYYWHVPKTGGVSFSIDLVEDFGLVGCFGRNVRKPYANATWAMEHGKCNYGNTEGDYGHSLLKFPSAPRNLLLLRDPVKHVVSQYSHCQMESDIKKWGHKRATLEDWLQHWLDAVHGDEKTRKKGLEKALSICHYLPENMQTRKLCDGYEKNYKDKRGFTIDECRETALTHVRDAWHVGHLEEYDRGLCLISLRKSGKANKHCHCTVPAKTFGVKKNHNAHSKSVKVNDRTTAMIANLTAADLVVWRAAVARFESDETRLAARCR